MNKAFDFFEWYNLPSLDSPINRDNLMKINRGLEEVDNRVITLDTTKFNKMEAQSLIKNIAFDLQTGILTKYYYNGSTEEINTGISKLNMNLRFDKENQILYIVNADGTEDPINLSVFITNYEFNDSDTIAHNVSLDGTVTSIVKEGSIEEKHLRPDYLADIKVEAAKAQASQRESAISESNAKKSENAAKTSETNASNSATKAESYAVGGTNSRAGEDTDNAKYYSQQANASDNSASASASTATEKASQAASSATNAANSATTATNEATAASSSASQAAASASNAAASASTAEAKASKASEYATQSQNYAVGNTNSAKYYYEQAKSISESFSGSLRPMGTVTFANLPELSDAVEGDMYNVSDQFITTSDFKEGIGNTIPAGANVYKTSDGYWDVLAGSPVTGVKGNAESTYRRGNVNITAANIGLGNVNNTADSVKNVKHAESATKAVQDGNGNNIVNTYLTKTGDTKDNAVTFTSGDSDTPTGWAEIGVIGSGEKHSSLWRKMSLAVKNLRYLWKLLGTTSLAGIGDGTVTGAISQLNTGMEWKLIGQLDTSHDVIEIPTIAREIQVVTGHGNYRMVFSLSYHAIQSAIIGRYIVHYSKFFHEAAWHEISEMIYFGANNRAWVHLITVDDAPTSDYVAWFWYR